MDSDVEKSLNSSHQKGDLGTLCKKRLWKVIAVCNSLCLVIALRWDHENGARRVMTGGHGWFGRFWLKSGETSKRDVELGFDVSGDWNYVVSNCWCEHAKYGPWFGREMPLNTWYCKEKTIIFVGIYLLYIYIINNFRGYFLWSAWLPWWRFTLFDVCRFFKWVLNLVSCWCTMEILTTSGKMFYESSLCLSRWWTFELFGMTSIRLSDDHPSTAHRT